MKTTKLLSGMLAASLLLCAGCTTPTTDPDYARAMSNGHLAPVQVATEQTGMTG